MFQLTAEDEASLSSQFVTSKRGRRRYRSYAFTEQGVAMLSSVLNSERAIQVNIAIMRAFVKLRQILSAYNDLARQLEAMEKKCDAQFPPADAANPFLTQAHWLHDCPTKPSHKK